MNNLWSDEESTQLSARYEAEHGRALALRTYSSRLIGREPGLVIHGGGNTSVKGEVENAFGEPVQALFVKASGHELAKIEPAGHVAVELAGLRRLNELTELSDAAMMREVRRLLFDPGAPNPSIEAMVHAVIPGRYVDHSHAAAVLTLTNQPDGETLIREALGEDVLIVPYVRPGFQLARRVAQALEERPDATAMVWMHHGVVAWAESAHESYSAMIDLVSRAEEYLILRASGRSGSPASNASGAHPSVARAQERLARVAPLVRGLLATESGDPDRPFQRLILSSLISPEVLDFLDQKGSREIAVSPPLTADHLIHTRPLPAWVESPDWEDEQALRVQIEDAFQAYSNEYRAYLDRNIGRMPAGVEPFEPLPRVVYLPGMGVLSAGASARAANVVRDITEQTLAAKSRIAAMGGSYAGLAEEHLFDMEYSSLQHAKLAGAEPPPGAQVVLVTGAAGAIGSGICARLLEEGAHVAVTDLPGSALDELVAELSSRDPDRVCGIPLDVTDVTSVSSAFDDISRTWGGVDSIVINAGLAHVSRLSDLDVEKFRSLMEVNTDGTLLLLSRAAHHLRDQGTEGDIVLISTKNVFAPGAGFGAYSATKAAAHQLARIASIELAEHGVRVNMVAPDAVFSHGDRPSGLWAQVGPDRMKARGLDAEGLEDYYRNRNLLKARVTADHVANAVIFFLSRQTPTTGATLPVDGGLPDATPR